MQDSCFNDNDYGHYYSCLEHMIKAAKHDLPVVKCCCLGQKGVQELRSNGYNVLNYVNYSWDRKSGEYTHMVSYEVQKFCDQLILCKPRCTDPKILLANYEKIRNKYAD